MEASVKRSMDRHVFEIDGREHVVFSQVVGNTLWIHAQGETFTVPLKAEKKRRAGAGIGDGNENEVLAPMPGKITQVPSKNGDAVKKGQILIVMEAMKMEYNLKAAADGTVEALQVKVGDQVGLGQLLVKMKAKT